jgi:hypothetical protein
LKLARQTLSIIEDEGRTTRSFVRFIKGMNELVWLTWSLWKTIGFINAHKYNETVLYNSFYIFDGPARNSFYELKKIVRLPKYAEAFSIKGGDVEFYTKCGANLETTGTIKAGYHSFPPKILLWR